MKTAIYIEDGTMQLVITPESDFEKDAMRTFRDKQVEAQMFQGSFYDCQGGWKRKSEGYKEADESLILRVKTENKENQ